MYLFYCDSHLGCRVMQDFDLCKFDDLWRHIVDIKWFKITKNGISLKTFSAYNWNFVHLVHLSQSSMICPLWHYHSNTMGSMPFLQKVKPEFSSFKKCYLLALFIQWVLAKLIWTSHSTSTGKSVWSDKYGISHFGKVEVR